MNDAVRTDVTCMSSAEVFGYPAAVATCRGCVGSDASMIFTPVPGQGPLQVPT